MLNVPPLSKNAYPEIVRAKALDMLGRVGEFTVNDLCKETGLKPTKNLRRRLAEMVYSGDLGYTMAYTESGHMAGFFIKPITATDQQLTMPIF